MRVPFSRTIGSCPSSRRRAAATRPAIPAPAIVTRNSGQGERRLVLDVLDPHALRTPHEDREGVRGVDDVVDLDTEVPCGGEVLVGRLHEHSEVVEEWPFLRTGLAGLELDPRAAHLHPRTAGRAGRRGAEAEGAVLRGRRLWVGGAQRDVVEAVIEVGFRFHEAERDAFTQLEVRLALPPADL